MTPKEQNTDKPKGVPTPVDIPENDNYDDYLEWTAEEEAAFLDVLKDVDE